MISTVTITRTSSAQVALEHPDDWAQEDVLRAVQVRAMDLAEKASFWSSASRTVIDSVAYDEDFREKLDDDAFEPQPLELTEEDLDAAPPPKAEPLDAGTPAQE